LHCVVDFFGQSVGELAALLRSGGVDDRRSRAPPGDVLVVDPVMSRNLEH